VNVYTQYREVLHKKYNIHQKRISPRVNGGLWRDKLKVMTSGGRDGIECAVIIKRDGSLLVVYVTEEANRKENFRLDWREERYSWEQQSLEEIVQV